MAIRGTTAGLALCLLAGCRSPTQIDVSVTTNVPCPQVSGTTITTGTLGEIETIPPAATTLSCGNGYVGSLVLVPSGADDALVGFKVVTAINGENVNDCVSDGGVYGPSCIVARRALRYLPHTPLQVDVLMSSKCAGIACDALSTCVEGQCVPATIGDPSACQGSGCGESILGGGDGGTADASIDATVPVDATTPFDAMVEDGSGTIPTEAGPTDAGPSIPDSGVPGCDTRGLLAGAAWPMENFCPSGRGRGPLVGPASVQSTPKWTLSVAGGVVSAPSIGPDGTLYVAGAGGVIEAVQPSDGGVVWATYPFGNPGATFSMPVLAADGTVRVLSYATQGNTYAVLAIDGGGVLLAVPSVQVRGGVTIGPDGTLYMGDTTGDFVELNPEGGTLVLLHGLGWDFTFPSLASSTGIAYSNYETGPVYGIVDGGELWSFPIDSDGFVATPKIAPDGTLRTFTFDDTVYKLNPADGGTIWQVAVFEGGAGDMYGMAVADDGTTYVGTSGGLFGYDTNGTLVAQNVDYSLGALTIDADGNLYAEANAGTLVSFAPSGAYRWSVTIPNYPGFTADAPVIGPGGMVYVGVNDNTDAGALVAFGP